MKFTINRDQLLKSLNYCQGVVEKRSTLPILSNVLIEAKNSTIKITVTDLDLIFTNFLKNVKIQAEGSTTTSAEIIYDIVRKLSSGSEISFNLLNQNKLQVESENLNLIYYVKTLMIFHLLMKILMITNLQLILNQC